MGRREAPQQLIESKILRGGRALVKPKAAKQDVLATSGLPVKFPMLGIEESAPCKGQGLWSAGKYTHCLLACLGANEALDAPKQWQA
eukprot:1660827-Amphidinium_carterae.2